MLKTVITSENDCGRTPGGVFFHIPAGKTAPKTTGAVFVFRTNNKGGIYLTKKPAPAQNAPNRGLNPCRWLYACYLSVSLTPLLSSPASAATNIWTKASEIMNDVYTQVLGISTVAAIVTAAVALLMMNFSRSGRTVDESRAWLKRIVIT